MDFRTWTWPFLAAVVVAYWVLVVGGWWWRTTRPATQARARTRHFAGAVRDPKRGEITVTYQASLDLTRIIAFLIGPPLLLVVGWVLARGA